MNQAKGFLRILDIRIFKGAYLRDTNEYRDIEGMFQTAMCIFHRM
jgi:hypothetical protein